jgi:hypothetical protein
MCTFFCVVVHRKGLIQGWLFLAAFSPRVRWSGLRAKCDGCCRVFVMVRHYAGSSRAMCTGAMEMVNGLEGMKQRLRPFVSTTSARKQFFNHITKR